MGCFIYEPYSAAAWGPGVFSRIFGTGSPGPLPKVSRPTEHGDRDGIRELCLHPLATESQTPGIQQLLPGSEEVV